MSDIADYAMTEVVLEDDRFVLYRARDARNAEVLLKVTRDGATTDQLSDLSADFLAARRCDVPAIPRAIRIETLATGGAFQVRQHVPGQPLSEWLRDRRVRPSQAEAMQIVLLLLRALEPVHMRGFVHCDLNPRTLLYDPDGHGLYFADCAWTRGYGAVTRRKSWQLTPYLAPEQVVDDGGKVDARADLYAVGVIGHELASGTLPPDDGFLPAGDRSLPGPFGGVIARLLSRDRENRHATAAAAARDITRCLDEWRGVSTPARLPVDPREDPETLRLPEELLGRHAVRAELSDALLEASNGSANLVLLTGDGGAGKSTVLADLQRSARASNALVLVGGFGLFDGDIPFRGLLPLCEELVEWLSTLRDDDRKARVARLRAALGDGCGVVTEAFPVLESILGIHPRPPATGTIERQNRLTYCVSSLFGALGSAGQPLVLLLEDIHWADAASLFILERLPGRDGSNHLLTVATVRTGMDGANDTFVSRLDALSTEHGQRVKCLEVPPFELGDTESFLAGALGMLPDATRSLASVLSEMSLGNPLAVRELVAEVTAQGLLQFDRVAAHWRWQPEAIRRSRIPEDVAQLFAGRVSSLPIDALEALRVAACLGGPFGVQDVATLLDRPEDAVEKALETCLQVGLVTRAEPTPARDHASFAFRHERIRSAVHGATPTAIQERIHAARGALLLAEHERTSSADTLFEALAHLNRSHSLRKAGADLTLAKLNLRGAVSAKEATAHDTAAQLLQHGSTQLPADVWSWDAQLAFDWELMRAECEHLCRRTTVATRIYTDLLERASSPRQRVKVLMARTQMLTNVGRFAETVTDGIASLKLLGVELPANPTKTQVLLPTLRMLTLHRRLRTSPPSLSTAGLDPTTNQIMACLAELWGPAFWVSENLTGLVVFAMVRLSLDRGNTAASSIAYCSYGVFLATAMKRYDLGKEICRLGLDVAEKADHPVYVGRTRFMYESFFGPYDRPLQEAPDRFREIAAALLRAGDYSYAGAAANMFLYYVAVVGTPLADFPIHVRDIVGVARQTDQSRTLLTVEILERWIAILDGREAYAPPKFLEDLTTEGGRGSENERGVFNLFEISLHYFLESHSAAAPHIAFMPGNRMLGGYFSAYFDFFHALILAKQRVGSDRTWLRTFRRLRRSLERESARCPRNYRHKALLLAAIEADVSNENAKCEQLFEAAIADARNHGFLPNAAIAMELLAEHYERLDDGAAAEKQLRAARLCYHQWGCLIKVGAIDRRLPESTRSERPPEDPPIEAEAAWPPRTGAVLEAARALSGEVDPKRLAERLIASILEHTRATRVVLLTRDDGRLEVACERRSPASPRGIGSAGAGDALPETVINYVDRLGRALRLRANSDHELFGRDPYMAAHAGAALLCVPIMNMRQRLGVLFLEKEAPGDLNRSDLVTSEILAAQAAATLSSAREYDEQLAALQNQMHPHFLFNALSGIAELTLADPPRAEQAIVGLATLYRNILGTSRRRAIPLEQELELVEAYLTIEKLRFGDRLAYRFDCPGEALRALVPPLVLQPLVENSVNHGIALHPRGGTIHLAVSMANQRVHIRVSDTGVGWSAGGSGRGAGLGLKSIRRRLELFFGSEVDLSVDDSQGVTVDLFFPVRVEERVG